MIAPHELYPDGRTQEVLIALRGLLSRNPCAAEFGPETLSELLHRERRLSYRVPEYVVESTLGALAVEGEVLA